jgi:hypothetical protein
MDIKLMLPMMGINWAKIGRILSGGIHKFALSSREFPGCCSCCWNWRRKLATY